MEAEITELIQTNGQIESKIFIYKVIDNLTKFSVAVIASSATQAKEALKKQISADAAVTFMAVVDKVMQVQ